jgi:hypothetical protein
MHEPRKTMGEKLPDGIARPDVQAANRKYVGMNSMSERAEKSMKAMDHIDRMLLPAQMKCGQ